MSRLASGYGRQLSCVVAAHRLKGLSGKAALRRVVTATAFAVTIPLVKPNWRIAASGFPVWFIGWLSLRGRCRRRAFDLRHHRIITSGFIEIAKSRVIEVHAI